MFRASPSRVEVSPTASQADGTPTTPLESVLALVLCAVVVLACVAFLRRSSALSRAIAELQNESHQAHLGLHRPQNPSSTPHPRPELVILISIDTLRADHLELYGYERETAPTLRQLGEGGVVFRTVCAQATQTLTSHKSIITGKYPATLMLEETGADLLELSNLRARRDYIVDTFSAVEGTLAEGLRQAGYRTGAMTDGAWMSREAGFAHGFDDFNEDGGGLEATLPRALAWLDESSDDPAFLFVHTYDVHCPYTSREPFNSAFCLDHTSHVSLDDKCGKGAQSGTELSPADRKALVDHYDGGILSADEHLGRFFEALRARNLFERALVIVTANHGESLGERGVAGHGGLNIEQLLVPLILKFPAEWRALPANVTEPVEMVDLLPTIYEICGVESSGDVDGRSLLPTLFRGVRGRDYLVAQTTFEELPELVSSPSKRTLLRPGRWQVIHDIERSEASFFALESDPLGIEGHPIEPEEFNALLDILLSRGGTARRALLRPSKPVAFSPEIHDALGQLGYGTTARAGQGPSGSLK